ncbi:hypothetical protein PIIN_00408 [Serendipita indica DSM 11827]|uniref:ZW10 C-terminal helical domain-containing protein n=1 Tax=Serendipita indica (strain DSM 11827) TaxID=1109443 RepID=G4T5X6_SERID|nr:hypothetical protein PIIN_00408 [Serendipita indica DSM 11827]
MAFPIPQHLPRATFQQPETSTTVLTSLADASTVTLELTSELIRKLNEEIQKTENAIHSRIHDDLEAFERQLDTSRSVHRRLTTLHTNVDALYSELEDSENGVIPHIQRALHTHSDLAQRTLNAEVLNTSLQHLDRCKEAYLQLENSISSGDLPKAMEIGARLQTLLDLSPPPLVKSLVLSDLKHLTRSKRDNVLEQLSKAYATCLDLKESSFVIAHHYGSNLTLNDILVSLPSEIIAVNLATLRKDLFSRFINCVLRDNYTVLRVKSTRIDLSASSSQDSFTSLLHLFTFLSEELLPHIPEPHRASFSTAFYNPLCDALQAHLFALVPATIDELPSYLTTLIGVIDFETKITALGFSTGPERRLQAWCQGVQTHYEKKRRTELLERARTIVLSQPSYGVTIEVEVSAKESVKEAASVEPLTDGAEVETANWDFDDEDTTKEVPSIASNKEDAESTEEDGDGWGFDDDEPTVEEKGQESEEKTHDPWGTNGMMLQYHQMMSTRLKPAQTRVVASPETYQVSNVAKEISELAHKILSEGISLLHTRLFAEQGFTSTRASLLMPSTPSVVDLFRALYPVLHSEESQSSLASRLRYSNDCQYLADSCKTLQDVYETNCSTQPDYTTTHSRFEETRGRLEVLATNLREDAIEEEAQSILALVANAGNFVDLGYDVRFTHASDRFRQIKNRITLISKDLQATLTRSVCYQSLGAIVDQVLGLALQDAFALEDIPEAASERIATLCRVLHPLDTLFPEVDGVSTVASYVPLWLKFTYLSDILEGSLMDINGWFDSGLLVDYEPQELSRLIKALFADSPVRANTISKIMRST